MVKIKKFESLGDAFQEAKLILKKEVIQKSIETLNELIDESETDKLIKNDKLAKFALQELIYNKIRTLQQE